MVHVADATVTSVCACSCTCARVYCLPCALTSGCGVHLCGYNTQQRYHANQASPREGGPPQESSTSIGSPPSTSTSRRPKHFEAPTFTHTLREMPKEERRKYTVVFHDDYVEPYSEHIRTAQRSFRGIAKSLWICVLCASLRGEGARVSMRSFDRIRGCVVCAWHFSTPMLPSHVTMPNQTTQQRLT